MAKIKKVANGEYIGANKYTIKDAGGGKSTVDFAPDSILTPGTEVGAELLNEMQLNALYTLDTNRVVEGQKEVYVANLEGFTDFTKPDLSFYLKINANNTNAQTYLRLDTTDYLIKCKINDLTKNSIVACRKVGSEIIVLNNYMQRQDDAIWGGLDGGGEIEDPAVIKKVGYRYYGADGKAYICIVPSNVNNADNYMPCNVVDNTDRLWNLDKREYWGEYGEVIIKHYPGGTKELTIPARTLDGEATLSLSRYFTEINAVNATTNTIYSTTTGSVNVVETQMTSNNDVRIKLTVLLNDGTMRKPSGANRVSVIVTGR